MRCETREIHPRWGEVLEIGYAIADPMGGYAYVDIHVSRSLTSELGTAHCTISIRPESWYVNQFKQPPCIWLGPSASCIQAKPTHWTRWQKNPQPEANPQPEWDTDNSLFWDNRNSTLIWLHLGGVWYWQFVQGC